MKITKRQLRRIIREEKRRILNEQANTSRLFSDLNRIVDNLISELGAEETALELEGLADQVRSTSRAGKDPGISLAVAPEDQGPFYTYDPGEPGGFIER